MLVIRAGLRGVCGALLVLALSVDARAAGTKDACADASEQAQTLRSQGRLRLARERLVLCSRTECPRVVREACDRWLGEAEASTPTIVVRARDPQGRDLTAVQVTLDGAPLVDRLDGLPLAIDPGSHTLAFRSDGAAPREEQVVIAEGEKNRILTVVLQPLAAAAAVPPSTSPPAVRPGEGAHPPVAPSADLVRSSRPIPALAVVFAGASLAAFAASTDLVLLARSNESTMRSSCAPQCSDGEYDAFNRKVVFADVTLGVGVAAAVAAAWVFLRRPVEREPMSGALWVGGQPAQGGFEAAVGGLF
jgi:hypothetical protein